MHEDLVSDDLCPVQIKVMGLVPFFISLQKQCHLPRKGTAL